MGEEMRADRERAAGYYSEMPFAAAQVLVEVPYLLAQAVLFSIISYWMVHFEADPGDPLKPTTQALNPTPCLRTPSAMPCEMAQTCQAWLAPIIQSARLKDHIVSLKG